MAKKAETPDPSSATPVSAAVTEAAAATPEDSTPAEPTPADAHPDVAGLSYEAARDELVGLVSRLESGQVGLEESMSLWARGEALAAHCAQWLDRAEARITADD